MYFSKKKKLSLKRQKEDGEAGKAESKDNSPNKSRKYKKKIKKQTTKIRNWLRLGITSQIRKGPVLYQVFGYLCFIPDTSGATSHNLLSKKTL